MIASKICLIILDGWGIGKKDFTNAIYQAKTPFIEELKKYYPLTTLQASGTAVGLPFGEPGNSEVGHLTLGTGQILYQYTVRISQSIQQGTFFQNPAFLAVIEHIKKNNSALHLIGLLSEAVVHSSYEHLLALVDLAKQYQLSYVYLHLFTDGRDSPPTAAKNLLSKLLQDLHDRGIGQVASLAGRFYGMDRDKNYERTQKVYEALVFGKAPVVKDPLLHLEFSYQKGITDEFLPPVLIGDKEKANLGLIKENDGIIFFNFREERMRQLVEPFVLPEFDKFPVQKFNNLKIATMTQYRPDFPVLVAFPPQKINISLAKILSENKKRQLHLAESEKYAHVTYFFDGLRDKPYPGEFWVIVPSVKTLHLEEYPELAAPQITQRLLQAFEENIYDFILVNYANGDLIGHTGDMEAGIKAAEIIDQQLQKVVPAGLAKNYTLLITADHGNLERMANPETGEKETSHDISLVPFHLVDKRLRFPQARSSREIESIEREAGGMLADVSPTILQLFNLPIPAEMTGQSLLPLLGIFKA